MRLARPGMMLRPDARGGFCVSASEDNRRRAAARVSALETRTMASEGLVEACGDKRFRISAAGRAFLTRVESGADAPGVPAADHVPPSVALRRLRVLAGAHGGFFSAAELRVAERL
jgi:hypothetical protein